MQIMINWKQIWQKTWPHMVAVGVFCVLVMVYFAPQVFNNKQLPQGDNISAWGMGHDAQEYHEKTGEWSHWSNAMFSGMPQNATYSVTSKSVFRYISQILICGFCILFHQRKHLRMCSQELGRGPSSRYQNI